MEEREEMRLVKRLTKRNVRDKIYTELLMEAIAGVKHETFRRRLHTDQQECRGKYQDTFQDSD